MLTESVHQRLSWFKRDLYQVSDSQVVITETKKAGEADVYCQVHAPVIAFSGLEGKNFYCLGNLRCADGIIFENYAPDSWRLHIMELKGTMGKDQWKSVKEQFEGAVLNAHALMGVLGIERINEIKCYTAFKKDWFHPDRSNDPIALRAGMGQALEHHPFIEWKSGNISILSISNIEHHKINIDTATKQGFVDLL